MKYVKDKIKDFEEYQIDVNGIVYSKRNKPLKYSVNHKGYCIVNLMKNGKRTGIAVHTLVAKQFIVNLDKQKTQVNHIDGNKQNNCVDNLEWVTPKENVNHAIDILGFNSKGEKSKNAKSIGAFDETNNLILHFGALSDAAKYFCNQNDDNYRYKQTSIYKALKGVRKTYKGLVWKYI